jgi:hypothetical protein
MFVGAIPPLPQYIFIALSFVKYTIILMAWCLVKYRIVFMEWYFVKHSNNFTVISPY